MLFITNFFVRVLVMVIASYILEIIINGLPPVTEMKIKRKIGTFKAKIRNKFKK